MKPNVIKSIFAAVFIMVAFAFTATAQTNAPDLTNEVAELKAFVATLMNQMAANAAKAPAVAPVISSVTYSNGLPVATNETAELPAANAVEGEFKPLTDLLTGKTKAFVATVIAWFSAIALVMAPFRNKLKHFISDRFNAMAENSSNENEDYLRRMFSKPWYQGLSLILKFAGISLPTNEDLNRAIALQKQAVADSAANATAASPVPPPPGGVINAKV